MGRGAQDEGRAAYDDRRFWAKVRAFAVAAGRTVIEKALTLYFCLKDPNTPGWAKAVIVGALGYFILPADAICDLIPGLGFTDDLGVLLTALATIATYVKPGHRVRARELMEWECTGRNEARAGGQGAPYAGGPPPGDREAYYGAILDLDGDFSPARVRDQYRDLAKKYHPDRVHHLGVEFQEMAEQKLKAINEAYAYFRNVR
ncbi:MAG: DUF1232 domain-containing protein [Kiritimatiellae bacterium]|nr:DUF1232 domain-containing protein [Kiritimatiellia bacterium]